MSDEGVVFFHTENTTVRDVLADATNRAEEFEVVIVLLADKEGNVSIAHSDGDSLGKVGMCALGMDKFVRDMEV